MYTYIYIHIYITGLIASPSSTTAPLRVHAWISPSTKRKKGRRETIYLYISIYMCIYSYIYIYYRLDCVSNKHHRPFACARVDISLDQEEGGKARDGTRGETGEFVD